MRTTQANKLHAILALLATGQRVVTLSKSDSLEIKNRKLSSKLLEFCLQHTLLHITSCKSINRYARPVFVWRILLLSKLIYKFHCSYIHNRWSCFLLFTWTFQKLFHQHGSKFRKLYRQLHEHQFQTWGICLTKMWKSRLSFKHGKTVNTYFSESKEQPRSNGHFLLFPR